MAHLEPKGVDALEAMAEELQELADQVIQVAQKCITEASPVMERAYMGAVGSVSGEVAASTATTPAKENSLGVYAVSRPVGFNSNGVRYAAIAAYFEYGVKAHKIPYTDKNGVKRVMYHPGIKKRSWHATAVSAAEAPTKAVVERVFDQEVKRLVPHAR